MLLSGRCVVSGVPGLLCRVLRLCDVSSALDGCSTTVVSALQCRRAVGTASGDTAQQLRTEYDAVVIGAGKLTSHLSVCR